MIISRKLSHLPSVGVVAASLAFAALVYAPVGIIQLGDSHPTTRVLASAVTLGVVCTAVAFVLFFALIAEIGPVRATVITYLNPAVALVLGVTILDEPLRIGAVLGFALILAGSYLATRRKPEAVTPAGKTASAGATEVEAAELR
jgi:drug/metabolite transporter (DMT)-like permease